jgi:hypothetical protein
MARNRQGGESRVELRVDDGLRRVFVTISGPATGPQVAGPVSALFRGRPELTAYDMLYDIREYWGDVSADDIEPIVDAYAAAEPDPARPTRTAFVTLDPYFHYWAEAMDEQFLARTHHTFPRLDAALDFLADPGATARERRHAR